jgi:hypothetical protein
MSACYCDYDQPAFYVAGVRKARKRHRCYECGCFILPGERYEHVSAKWDDVSTVKTCSHCLALRDWVVGNIPCSCWTHGDMVDGLWSSIEDAVDRAPEETKGIMFGFLRRRFAWKKSISERRAAYAVMSENA